MNGTQKLKNKIMKKTKDELQKCKMIVYFKNGGKDIIYMDYYSFFFTNFQLLVHEKWHQLSSVYFEVETSQISKEPKMLDIIPKSTMKYLITAQQNYIEFDYFLTNSLIGVFEFIQLRLKVGAFNCSSFKIYFNQL